MKFALEPLEQGYTIKAYAPEWIQINTEKHYQSLLLMPDQIIGKWPITNSDQISVDDIQVLADYQPQIILLGTGASQQILAPKLFASLMAQGIGYEVMATGAACRTYNVLLSEGRKVLAALIL